MKEKRGIGAALLTVMLAVVVAAGLAVTAFAEGTPVADRQDLVDVLNGDKSPSAGINYDVDGNGIIEKDDLAAFDGTQADALPEGGEDLLKKAASSALQSKVVRGDSTLALAVKNGQSVTLTFAESQNFAGAAFLKMDALWAGGTAGSFRVIFHSGDKQTVSASVAATEAGWSAVQVPLTFLDQKVLTSVSSMEIIADADAYFDNFCLGGEIALKQVAMNLDHSGYKQLRFKFRVPHDGVILSYADNTDVSWDDPFIVILDEANEAVKAADVKAGQWYTAVIYGTEELYNNEKGRYWSNATIAQNGTLTINEEAEMGEVDKLTAQFGYRLQGVVSNGEPGLHTKKDMWAETGTAGLGYYLDWSSAESYMAVMVQSGHYRGFTFDFYMTQKSAEEGPDFVGIGRGWDPVFYDAEGNVVEDTSLQTDQWYTAKVDTSNWITVASYYIKVGNEVTFSAYIANMNWLPADVMYDHVTTTYTQTDAQSVTLTKNGTDGSFFVERITRDDLRGVYNVKAGDGANRSLKITLADTTKELIQVDFRYLSADGTPAMAVSADKYVIVDKDDNIVTGALQVGQWYRLFITVGDRSSFVLTPASTGAFELQLENLATYNTDELVANIDRMPLILTKFGKLEYVYTGNDAVTVKLNSAAYKQLRFMMKGDATITSADAQVVVTEGTGGWKTVVITNNGEILRSLTLTISNNTGLRIKDMAGYQTVEAPAQKAENNLYRGLYDDEMIIGGYIGPTDLVTRSGEYLPTLIRDDIFKLLANSGINYIVENVQNYSGESLAASQEILRLASKYNLNYLIGNADIALVGNEAEDRYVNEDVFAAKLAEMVQYESFGGLYLRDEPTADMFVGRESPMAKATSLVMQYAQDNNVRLNIFGNLFPNLGEATLTGGASGTGVTDWNSYIQNYINYVGSKTGYVLYDSYPFIVAGEDGETIADAYVKLLSKFAKKVQDNGLQWGAYIQVGGGEPAHSSNSRPATENEITWMANNMLAFGAKALHYYIAVSPDYYGERVTDETINTHSLINIKGEPTDYYYNVVANINAQVKAIDHVLMKSEHLGVILVGSEMIREDDQAYSELTGNGYITQIKKNWSSTTYSDVKLSNVTGNHVLIGAFDYNDGQTALLVVNNNVNVEESDSIGLTFDGSYTYEIISNALTSWQSGETVSLTLEPGRSALVLVHQGAVSMDASVIFNMNDNGASFAPPAITVEANGNYPELPVPVRDGCEFKGWYLDAACTGTPVKSGDKISVNGDHVLYAKWYAPPKVVAAAEYLQLASEEEKTAVGIPAGQKMYIYTKSKGEAADPAEAVHPAEIYFDNAGGYDYISFDFYCKHFNSNSASYGYYMCLSNGQGSYIGLGSNLQVTDAATGKALEVVDREGTWFTLTPASGGWQTITCPATELSKLYIALFGATDATLYITNVHGSDSLTSDVIFDLNYEGAENTYASREVTKGVAYGELPAPEREGFTFDGWFMNEEGLGAEVTAETLVNVIVEHTLYAKWVEAVPDEPDRPDVPDDSTLVARNPAYLSVATPDELAAVGITDATGIVYHFTKPKDGSSDINSGDYGLWLANRNGDAYVTFDVCCSEAIGKNPYLLLVTRIAGGDTDYLTTSDGITFVKKGTDISATESDGAYNWIELNTWYTVTIPMAARSEIYLGWDGADTAEVFITNIVWTPAAAPEEAGLVPNGSLSVATREQLNAAGITDAGTTYLFNRVANGTDKLLLNNQSGNAYVTFDIRYSAFNFISEAGQSGRAYLLLTPNNGGTWLTTGSNGVTIVKKGTDTAAEVFSGAYNLLELNTWYTVTVPVAGIENLQIAFNGMDSATALIANVTWTPSVAPEEAGLATTENNTLGMAGWNELAASGNTDVYGKAYSFTTSVAAGHGGPNGGYALWLKNKNDSAWVTFDVYYSAFSNAQPYFLISDVNASWMTTEDSAITIVQKGTGTSSTERSDAYNDVALNTWYTVTVPVKGLDKLYLSWDGSTAVTALIANVTWTPSVAPEEVGLVARTPDFLNVATWSQLNAARINDATGTVYRFTKGVGSADINNGDYGLWLENRNSNAYVTFDVRYSEAAGKNPYLLLITRLDGGNTDCLTTSDGIIFVKKGTDISAEESDGAYNWIELNTWYTVTIPMAARSEIYLGWDTYDTAEVFITNIVWTPSVAPEEAGLATTENNTLGMAGWNELAASGNADAYGKAYSFTTNSAAGGPGGDALWLENKNGSAWVTFDVYYSAFSKEQPYLLISDVGSNWMTTENSAITIVQKGTGTSSTVRSKAYNDVALNAWYTVTVPVTGLDKLYLSWDTGTVVTALIANVVWHD